MDDEQHITNRKCQSIKLPDHEEGSLPSTLTEVLSIKFLFVIDVVQDLYRRRNQCPTPTDPEHLVILEAA
ncbi:hypothetical protein J6590_056512 [Homalodisca vitripennis]|nr:hypothetical protein J6590_056512 [Homalodisca vitripennis]